MIGAAPGAFQNSSYYCLASALVQRVEPIPVRDESSGFHGWVAYLSEEVTTVHDA